MSVRPAGIEAAMDAWARGRAETEPRGRAKSEPRGCAQSEPRGRAESEPRGRAGGEPRGGPDGIDWLDRAVRLAPGDPRIRLDLAQARLAAGQDLALAAADFAALAQRYDLVPAWAGLALAQVARDDLPAAAAALGSLLARHAVGSDAPLRAAMHHIAVQAGFDGIEAGEPDGRLYRSGAGRLLGTPDAQALAQLSGIVAPDAGGLAGWAVRPAAPQTPPVLTLIDAQGRQMPVTCGDALPADEDAPFLPRYAFAVPAADLAGLTPPLALRGAAGAMLPGAPLDPGWLSALAPLPPATASAPTQVPARTPIQMPARAPLAIILPLYRGQAEAAACLASLRAAAPAGARIIMVDDAAPESGFSAWAAAQSGVELCVHAENRGYPAAVNTGLQAAGPGWDALVVNADTLVPKSAIATLRRVAYGQADTGTVAPWSNEATILSYPDPQGGNPMPDLAAATAYDRLARRVHGLASAALPTTHGFCMYLRHDCLAAVGGLRPEVFAQGYGEENDFSIRAARAGFAHRLALGAYVAHRGGVSFGAATRALMGRNMALLARLDPTYHARVAAFVAADPLRPARAALQAAALRQDRRETVLVISHSHGGGVARQVAVAMAEIAAAGRRALLLTTAFPADPVATTYPWPAQLGDAAGRIKLAFALPADQPAFMRLLRRLSIREVQRHHMLGHHVSVRSLAARLGVPETIVVHDYAAFCPRVNLLAPDAAGEHRYCGEPAPAACTVCCATHRDEVYETLPVPRLLARSARELAVATRVVTPSADAARRLTAHFPGVRPLITPWEDDAAPRPLKPPRNGARRILTLGGIGPQKGFSVLRDCARDAAARALALDFVIVGPSADDRALLDTGRIFLTGTYRDEELPELIRRFDADLAFLPSIWPETWCFTLGECWKAGLYAIAFDLGAQGARIRATGRGAVLPLGLPAPRINEFLLNWRGP
jgi:GT2 family glycosyltransferase/glycosyltransferase involved in cell wall biosynthesis